MRILIVDDDIQVLEVLYGILKKPDTEVDCAGSCEQAKYLLTNNHYDWVTLDFHLGDGTGIDLLKIIHADYPTTKTIFFTSTADTPEFASKVARLGAEGVLSKPTQGAELITHIYGKIRE